jgi:hypothetical protein
MDVKVDTLAADSGRITSNSNVTRLGKGCRPFGSGCRTEEHKRVSSYEPKASALLNSVYPLLKACSADQGFQ